jgi:hypothetical protein
MADLRKILRPQYVEYRTGPVNLWFGHIGLDSYFRKKEIA